MSRRQRVGQLLLGSFIIAGLITGCTASQPGATQAPTSSDAVPVPSPSPSETAPSADPLSTVTALVARPEALELQDESGAVVQAFDYRSDVTEALGVLTAVLGEPPIDTDYPGGSHDAPSTAHRWGAFELWEARYVDNWEGLGEPRTFYMPSFRTRFTGAESAGITLTTLEQISAGSSWSELSATPELQTNPSGCSGPYLDYVEYQETDADGNTYVQKVSVDFRPTDDGATVGEVRAPVPVYEEGCA
ncbi:hypothetical protein ASC66_16385 [Leifsonia sp. Root4]|uniref:hypothetical protein n=1 Tax=Leifsonia sp. Root4 TaxID=1736525 RepID=UPI0007006832|nr:hypothetical protein [Leifsonia sp. Root4]KQW04036.1 hypothetical protein ASC66_16385 [Leifsonia sp. Root4]